jgi:nephrocystin-3
VAALPEEAALQNKLKGRIRGSGFPVIEDYGSPEVFADRLEADLSKILDEAYPPDDVPDAFERESRLHEAYASPRRRLYLGGERYLAALDEALGRNAQRVLIEGASGGGKSALLANWLDAFRKAHPDDLIHEHYLGASTDAADPVALVRRLIEAIKRRTDSSDDIPADPQSFWKACRSGWRMRAPLRRRKEPGGSLLSTR